jgi:hypothetical protein
VLICADRQVCVMDMMKLIGSSELTRGVWLTFNAYCITFCGAIYTNKGCQMLIFIGVQVKNVIENAQNVLKQRIL